jgi:phosphoribosylformylglycinamidine cyclo-ligase
MSIGEALLVPHRSYLPIVGPLLGTGRIKGMAHITGGGISENLPRILPPGTHAVVERSAWKVPPIFEWLQARGNVPETDMFRAFNMGLGLIVVCDEEDVGLLLDGLADAGGTGAARMGTIRDGGEGVRYVSS